MQLDPENHVYKLNNNKYTSVTTLVHMCFGEFDTDVILSKMKRKGTQYEGMTDDEIKEVWKNNATKAQQQGTRMHSVIERYYKKESILESENVLPEISQFHAFEKHHALTPYQVEWLIYSESDKLAGTVDFTALNADGTLDVYDWKRSKHIELNNPYEKYSHVVSHIPDTNYWHYTIQVNLYKYMIEKEYGKVVRRMYLVCFYPNQLSFQKYEVSNVQSHVPEILQQLKLKQSS